MDSVLDRFYRAWFAPELRFLGYQCRPYCLGHLLTLQAIDSPFTKLGDPGVTIGVEDLLLAMRVCADSEWPFRAVPLEAGPHEVKLMARFVRFRGAFKLAVERFVDWLTECSLGPELIAAEGDEPGRKLGAPEVLIYAAKLMPKFSEERVFSMPLSLVRYYMATVSEMEGTLSGMMMTPELRAAMKHTDELPDYTKMTPDEIEADLAKSDCAEHAQQWRQKWDETGGQS